MDKKVKSSRINHAEASVASYGNKNRKGYQCIKNRLVFMSSKYPQIFAARKQE